MQYDRSSEQDGSGHCQKLGVEAACPIEKPGDTAANQKCPAGQSPQQSHTYTDLLARRRLAANVLLKM